MDLIANLLSFTFLLVTMVCLVRFVKHFGDGVVTFLDFLLLGFGVFMAFDIVAHNWIRPDVFRFSPELELFAGMMTMACLGLVLAGYSLGKRLVPKWSKMRYSGRTVLSTSIFVSRVMPAGVALLCANYWLGGLVGSAIVLIAFAARTVALLCLSAGILQKRPLFAAYGLTLFLALFSSSEELSRRAYVVPIFVLLLLMVGTAGVKMRTAGSIEGRYLSGLGLVGIAVLSVALRISYNVREEDSVVEHVVRYLTNVTPIDTYTNTLRVLEIFPERAPYIGFRSYLCTILNWVPREMRPWEGYSIAPLLGYYVLTGSASFDHAIWKSESSYSLTPGIVGEAWASFGLVGIVVMPLLIGACAGVCDGRLAARRIFRQDGRHRLDDLPILVWMPAFLLLGRGDMYSAAYYSLPTSIMLWGILRVVVRQPRNSTSVLRKN